MPDSIKFLKEQLEKKEKEFQYFKRILVEISNKNLRELEEISKVTDLLREKEQIQERLHIAKRMESIGLMVGGVAHDLNNILSGIINYPEILLLDLPEDSPLRKPICRIHESGQRAAAVVADLLTVARGVATPKNIHDLNNIAGRYIRSSQYENLKTQYPHILYEIKLSKSPLPILCSEVHVTKCICNLMANAAEAIEGEGKISFKASSRCIESSTWKVAHGKYAILQVCDSGHGIPQKSLDQIFEPFYTKKIMGRSGTGLGLCIVWNTMEDHKGYVEVTSGKSGSCFDLYFPFSEKGKKQAPLKVTKNQLQGSGTILVVDDEEIQRDIATEILSNLGYHVESATSGEEAIHYIRSHSIDLVLLDMIMGKGMTGYETYKTIIKVSPGQKALIATGYSESDDVKKTIQLGAGGFIRKPYTFKDLGLAVRQILHK